MWDNAYFVDLLEYDWVQEESPAGATQWIPVPKEDDTDTHVPDIIMLTTDIALLYVGAGPRVGHVASILPVTRFLYGECGDRLTLCAHGTTNLRPARSLTEPLYWL